MTARQRGQAKRLWSEVVRLVEEHRIENLAGLTQQAWSECVEVLEERRRQGVK